MRDKGMAISAEPVMLYRSLAQSSLCQRCLCLRDAHTGVHSIYSPLLVYGPLEPAHQESSKAVHTGFVHFLCFLVLRSCGASVTAGKA